MWFCVDVSSIERTKGVDMSDIEKYCRDRLEEIRQINAGNECPSAFVCIVSLIAYLSRLAYGTNEENDRKDGKWFRDFVKNFMPPKYLGHEDLLYRIFRCGISHSMSFDSEITTNRGTFLTQCGGQRTGYPELAISHDPQYSILCSGSNQLMTLPGTNTYVLVDTVLCDDIEWAIGKLFADSVASQNAEEFAKCQRPIDAIVLALPSVQTMSGQQTTLTTKLSC